MANIALPHHSARCRDTQCQSHSLSVAVPFYSATIRANMVGTAAGMGMGEKRLSARYVQTAGEGYHADGSGLYLQVTASGSRRNVVHTRKSPARRGFSESQFRYVQAAFLKAVRSCFPRSRIASICACILSNAAQISRANAIISARFAAFAWLVKLFAFIIFSPLPL